MELKNFVRNERTVKRYFEGLFAGRDLLGEINGRYLYSRRRPPPPLFFFSFRGFLKNHPSGVVWRRRPPAARSNFGSSGPEHS
ncbi:hypothetical protein CEXT_497331 [Caerostris extrusa]|uniref:Uncharacterized protein n=1 Tax=Caerostris extrusa TaxID=172846 RepID=A0AAV4N9N0_CAEEX|nr:hypothetical protein CEXT_497331 [Caerostris extrusa]